MSALIKDENPNTHGWKVLSLSSDDTPHTVRLPVGPVLVPLSVWRARRVELIHREYEHGWPLGVWLGADESADAIEDDIDDFTVIAVEFNKLADSNGLSNAHLLRERYSYRNELRAIGDVPRDKLSFLSQAGFDSVVAHEYKSTSRGDQAAPTRWSGFIPTHQPVHLATLSG